MFIVEWLLYNCRESELGSSLKLIHEIMRKHNTYYASRKDYIQINIY